MNKSCRLSGVLGVLVVIGLMATSCIPKATPPRLMVLLPAGENSVADASGDMDPLVVAKVQLPTYLAASDMHFLDKDGYLGTIGGWMWAAPLDSLATDLLRWELRRRCEAKSAPQAGKNRPQLNVRLERFALDRRGNFLMEGQWSIRFADGRPTLNRRIRKVIPAAAGVTVDGRLLARSAGQALAMLADDVAAVVNKPQPVAK